MAVAASAPVSPKADTSPDGVTEPPAPSATTAAVIGPSEAAVSASSRCSPSAAVPAIPINAQLTAAIADSRTSPHGSLAVLSPSRRSWPHSWQTPRSAARTMHRRFVPLAWDYHSPARFQPRQRQRPIARDVALLRKARLSVRGPSLK